MPPFVLAVIFVFALRGECAQAATTLYLPRQFEPSEMSTFGVAFVNPTTTAASATFRLRNAQGESVTTAQRTIPPKGQIALARASVAFRIPAFGLFQQSVASLFPAQADRFDSNGYLISILPDSSTAKVIGTTVTPNPGSDNIVTN